MARRAVRIRAYALYWRPPGAAVLALPLLLNSAAGEIGQISPLTQVPRYESEAAIRCGASSIKLRTPRTPLIWLASSAARNI